MIKLPTLDCKRCGHKWVPRKTEVLVCPKCHSPYWNRAKANKRKIGAPARASPPTLIK